jgi:gas vesicle structural protein
MSIRDDELHQIGDDARQISLCETLDRVLNKGVVLAGEVIISVADIELVYLNLRVLLTSTDTVERHRREARLAASALAGGTAR